MVFKLHKMNRSFQHGFIAGVLTVWILVIIVEIINQIQLNS